MNSLSTLSRLKNNLLVNSFSLATVLLVFVFSVTMVAQAEEPVSVSFINNVAIGGHSSSAYHQQERAVKGEKGYFYEWKGAKWPFATGVERDLFASDPDLYGPAYNGFCANALSLGEGLVKTNGKHWRIIDDNLYLFYSAKGRGRWDTREYIQQATAAWQQELAKRQ